MITKVKELDKELFLHCSTLVCCPVHYALISTNVTHAVATNSTFKKVASNVHNSGTFRSNLDHVEN
jgi:hypothetical protein